ncbi:uncharacterized protein LOC106651455 [Trichogramma pretiosum]|uniref:uncharacterized protein LOC106651455 n=1 Tax=Trichogramma pretiosum TaxID=7493 RepID=UPI0006C95F02|nr:uncharacterized protein LOC106651455 [Trichogramma pretiosum]
MQLVRFRQVKKMNTAYQRIALVLLIFNLTEVTLGQAKKRTPLKDIKPYRPNVECDDPNKPCDVFMSVDLANGTRNKDGSVSIGGVTIPATLQFRYYGQDRGCPCGLKKCIRLCCPRGLVADGDCRPPSSGSAANPRNFFDELPDGLLSPKIKSLDDDFYVIHEMDCSTQPSVDLFVTGPNRFAGENFTVTEDGELIVESYYTSAADRKKRSASYGPERYCIGWSEKYQGVKVQTCRSREEVRQAEEAGQKLKFQKRDGMQKKSKKREN